jgi:hypothetical protein
LDQAILLFSTPFLDFLFSLKRREHILRFLEINQFVNVVLACEARDLFMLVFKESAHEVSGDPYVHHLAIPVC